MLKLGVQQAEDIAKGVGPARDVHPPVRGPQPIVAQKGLPGPAPDEQSPPRCPAPSGLGWALGLPGIKGASSAASLPCWDEAAGPLIASQRSSPWTAEGASKDSELVGGSPRKGWEPPLYASGGLRWRKMLFYCNKKKYQVDLPLCCCSFLRVEVLASRAPRLGATRSLLRAAAATLCYLAPGPVLCLCGASPYEMLFGESFVA